jgi:hypothetical protein
MAAAAAMIVAGSVGFRFWNERREEAAAVAGIQGSIVLYNVQQWRVGAEWVAVHRRDDGRYVACGMTFTAISAPRNTLIESVVAYRMPEFCAATSDIVATTDP